MRVRLLKDLSQHKADSEIDSDHGAWLVSAGYAEEVSSTEDPTEDEQADEPEPATTKPRAPRKPRS